jgi:hypothetical protein
MAAQTSNHRKTVVVGVSVMGIVVALLATLQICLPQEYRACALMPGFCKSVSSRQLKDFEKLDRGYGSGPKFGLSASR